MIDRAKPLINSRDVKTMCTPTLLRLLLNSHDAAKALAVSEKTLWTLTAPRGSIPAIRVGERSVRYSVTQLQRWIDAQPVATATAATNGDTHD